MGMGLQQLWCVRGSREEADPSGFQQMCPVHIRDDTHVHCVHTHTPCAVCTCAETHVPGTMEMH